MTQPTTASRSERLLVVEDDPFSQELIALYLRKAGFTDVTAATDGRQALDLAKTSQFDLVLLDLNLPRISGTDVLRRLKKEGYLADTPVVLISSLTNMEETILCLDLGAEDYLPKPFNVRLLDERVSACLERHRLRRQVQAAAVREEVEREASLALLKGMAVPVLPPPSPAFPVQYAVGYDPAPAIGGDFIDLFRVGDAGVGFVIGTAEGEGVPATLAAVRVHTLIRQAVERALLSGTRPDPGTILQRVNAEFHGSSDKGEGRDGRPCSTVATLFGLLDSRDGEVRIANAGFADALALDPARGVTPVTAPRGRPVGAYAEAVYTSHAFQLNRGATLVAMTDGFAETTNPASSRLGEQRVQRALDKALTLPPTQLVASLYQEAAAFAESAPQSQDRSVLALVRD